MSVSTSSLPAKRGPAWVRRYFNRTTLVAFIFLFPSLVGFITFYLVPAVRGVMISFTDWDLLTESTFIGLQNYERLIQDPAFRNSLKVRFLY